MPPRPPLAARVTPRQVLIYFHPTVWSQMRYLRGIAESSRPRGWCIRIVRAELVLPELEAASVRYDGIIGCTPEGADAAILRRLAPNRVGMDCPQRDWADAYVDTDDRAIGEAAAAHFLERGFRNVAVVPTQLDLAYGDRRAAAFTQHLRQRGALARTYRHSDRGRAFNTQALARWLRRQEFPVAIYGVDDLVASYVLRACVFAGLRVPQDVAVLGADNIEELALTSAPPLSTVDVPLEQIGFRSAEILHAMLEGQSVGARSLVVPPTSVITRASTDALAVNDTLLVRAYKYLRERLADGVNVRDMEQHLHAGRRQIERRAAQGWGCSPMEMIQRLRVAEAKHLLAHTNRTVEDIAQASGFASARALLKQFKRQVRLSPSAFRAEHQTSDRTAPAVGQSTE